VRKCKVETSAAVIALVVRKASGKRGHGGNSIRSGTLTSTQELALAKPLKCSTKFVARSSGLSAVKKASLARVNAASKKPKRVLDLFGSNSIASDGEAVPSERPQKCPQESSILKEELKPPPAGGKFD
jgi:hypothetical protein